MDTIYVLHVDDEPSFGDLVSEFLQMEDERIEVITETSADNGITRIESTQERIDCIVSDYDMPGMDGLEFLKAIRDEYSNLPFILYTGKGSEEVASDAMSLGATDYLQKGSGTEQYELLANRVRNAVEQYRSTQEAKQTRRRLRNLAESTTHCVWMFDSDWEDLLFISGYEEVWNRPTEAIRENPQDFLNGVHPDHRDFVWDAMERMSNGESIDIEYRIRRGDGEHGWVWVQGEPVFDDNGNVKSVVGFTRDITDRKQRERELERYERIVEKLPVGVFRTTPEGEFIDVNEHYKSLLDVKSENDLVDTEAQEFWADPDDRETLLHQLEEEGVVEGRELEIETLDGESKWVETTLRITDEGENRYLDGIAHDVTEQREWRRHLEQAETMFENAQDALFLIDVGEEFTVERVNPAYEEATDLSNDALAGQTPRDILGNEQGATIEQKYRECVEHQTTLEYEETLSIDGNQTYWDTRIAPVLIDGEVEKIVGATRNITDRKKREQQLKLIETLFEHAEECQFIVDVADGEFKLCHANKYYKRTVGLSPDEPVTGETPTELFGETGGQEIVDRYRECVETRESVTYTVEVPVPEEGTVYRTILTPVVTDGKVTHIVGTARDITELTEREKELREERAFINQSLNALEDVFYVFSAEREILRWNDRLSEVTGYDDEEIAGMEPADFFPTDHQPRIAEAVTEVLETGNTTVQADFLTTDGKRIPHEFTGFRLTDPDGDVLGFVGIGRDLRRQREYERQLEQRNERLEEFTSIVSHDLRNPLNVAESRLELAQEDCDSEHLEHVDRAIDRMDALIEDLLMLARQGKAVTDLEPVDLATIIENCWANVETGNTTLVTDIDGMIYADKSRLKQVFENLVRNAVEHTDEESTVNIGELADGFYFEDDGPGIPEDERENVFDPGYSMAEDSTGFGLSIVKQVIDAHGWDIRVTEGSAGGARFEIFGVEFDR